MKGVSMDKIVTKKKIFMVVSSGRIHEDFLRSFCDFSIQSRNKFDILLHMCNENEQYMDILEKFTEDSVSDVIIFVKPTAGFSVQCIYDL